jgi:hypothetical protein
MLQLLSLMSTPLVFLTGSFDRAHDRRAKDRLTVLASA